MTLSAKNCLNWFKECCNNKELVETLKKIKFIVSDVDGALTNSWVYTTSDYEGGRCFSTLDGHITGPAIKAGINIALVSGKVNGSTRKRGQILGIPEQLCIEGKSSEKITTVMSITQKLGLTKSSVLIFGDDYLDAKVKIDGAAELYACPENTPFYLQNISDIVVPLPGGVGSFRLLLDLILFLQENHFAQEFIRYSIK